MDPVSVSGAKPKILNPDFLSDAASGSSDVAPELVLERMEFVARSVAPFLLSRLGPEFVILPSVAIVGSPPRHGAKS